MATSAPAREAWDAIAVDYDEFVTPLVTPIAAELLGRIDVHPGTRLLDVAAGTGALALAAARRGAHVVATDIAPTMIEHLTAVRTPRGSPTSRVASWTLSASSSRTGVSTFRRRSWGSA